MRSGLGEYVQENIPYVLYLAAVAASAFWSGWRAGVFAALLSVAAGSYLFAEPRSSFRVDNASDIVSALLFMLAASGIIAALAAEARARERVVERDARLRRGAARQARLERELEEARRLESLGRLAGGVAHDFNNLLSVVLGSSELLAKDLPENELLTSIQLAAKRGADLTRQLLGLARRQMMMLEPIALNDTVREIETLARRLIPEDIRIETDLPPDLWLFEGDATQVGQVVLNLVTNARDALPHGGVITLSTKNITLDARRVRSRPDMRPGEYVVLRVTDNGTGISAELQRRIFDPFFSTKPDGLGTGLGLAVSYGIVKQLNGFISVRSREGQGARFEVYWPRQHVAPKKEFRAGRPLASDNEPLTVLLVEDDPMVRKTTQRMLRASGHEVLVADNGAAALELVRVYCQPVDLLVTDVVMPRMNGKVLSESLRETHPELRVLYISGYTDNVVLHKGILEPGVHLLRKPFTQQQLELALREVTGADLAVD